jgi:hypothetical protein
MARTGAAQTAASTLPPSFLRDNQLESIWWYRIPKPRAQKRRRANPDGMNPEGATQKRPRQPKKPCPRCGGNDHHQDYGTVRELFRPLPHISFDSVTNLIDEINARFDGLQGSLPDTSCVLARGSSCPFCAAGLGWLGPTACLGFVAGEFGGRLALLAVEARGGSV